MNAPVPHCVACGHPLPSCQCHVGIMQSASPIVAAPPLPAPTRFRIRYGVVYCEVCGLSSLYCKGHAPAAPAPGDGAESDLNRRIRALKGAP